MKNQLLMIVERLRSKGLNVEFNGYGTAYIKGEGIAFESFGNSTRIYKNSKLIKEYKKPPFAIPYVLKICIKNKRELEV